MSEHGNMQVFTDSEYVALAEADLAALRGAKRRLENPSLTARISALLGSKLETGFNMLPARLHHMIGSATEIALRKGLDFTVKTMGRPEPSRPRDWLHKALAVGTGVAGGAFGAAALPVELPVSTCLMLRSIADIARSEGHDISLLEVRLACLEVFALGGGGSADDATESGYWIVRGALSKYLSEAATHLARKGLTDKSAPALARLLAQIAARFGVVVSEQAAAQLVPVVGAVSGGAINYLFMDHFQDMAKGHFVVKRLEEKYGTALVRKAYEELTI
ncbi:MAG: peptidase [Actinobacteria bacterium RBG_16_64_13]|nr:MAG: peptidase [Actinobacteria bacterium RBG_16_64_13]